MLERLRPERYAESTRSIPLAGRALRCVGIRRALPRRRCAQLGGVGAVREEDPPGAGQRVLQMSFGHVRETQGRADARLARQDAERRGQRAGGGGGGPGGALAGQGGGGGGARAGGAAG